jgi:hypothetical protein
MYDPSHLIIASDDSTVHEWLGRSIYDLNTSQEVIIDNPYFEFVWRNGLTIKGTVSLEYNHHNGLFAMACLDSTYPGYKLAITDLNGTQYQELTSGDYIDDHPCWGPDHRVIFFDRRDVDDYIGENSTVMAVDIQSGRIWELVNPAALNGATDLSLPDY